MFLGAILYAIFHKNYLFSGIFAHFLGIIRKDVDLGTVFSVRLGFFSASNKYICRRVRNFLSMANKKDLHVKNDLKTVILGPFSPKMRKWPYLCPEAKNPKNKGTSFSSVLKVEEKKVALFVVFGISGQRYGHFLIFVIWLQVVAIIKNRVS